MKKIYILAAACALALAGCGKSSKKNDVSYKDGVYTAKSSEHINSGDETEGNGYGIVTITIENGEITDCQFKTYELDGTLKDENYGKENGEIANKEFYNRAQKAMAACDEYANQLVMKGDLDSNDVISGATVNYDEFQEAAGEALAEAEE